MAFRVWQFHPIANPLLLRCSPDFRIDSYSVDMKKRNSSLPNSLYLFLLRQDSWVQIKSCFSLFLFYFGCFNTLGINNLAVKIGHPAFI